MRNRKKVREQVGKRANDICEYCRCPLFMSTSPFSIEHIESLAKGGSEDINNLALACQGCNNFKYDFITAIDPISGESFPLFHPRKDKWEEHFNWNEDYSEIMGISPTGRATVEKLKLNREGCINQRRILAVMGLHP